MLNAVIRLSLKYRLLVVVVSLVALGYGGYLATRMPIDVFPDLDRPRVVVMTEAPNMASERVESQITFPLESALLGATGVQDVRSQSALGLSVIYVEFDWGTDIRVARQTVQERLNAAGGELPETIRPQLAPISSIMGQIMVVALQRRPGPRGGTLAPIGKTGLWAERVGDGAAPGPRLFVWNSNGRRDTARWESVRVDSLTWSAPTGPDLPRSVRIAVDGRVHDVTFPPDSRQQLELRSLADWVIRPRLLKTTGVAQVVTLGGGRKQYQVLVDPRALAEYEVSLQQIEQALRDNNVDAGGGFATSGEAEKAIRVMARIGPAPAQVLEDLKRIPIKTTPQRTILLEQVAKVVEGAQLKRGDGSVNGSPGVVLTLTKQPHVDTRGLTERVVATLQDTESGLPADVQIVTDLYQIRGFIDRAVANVGLALRDGAILVLIVLFLFLLNLRTTFISLTAIPLSLVLSVLVFKVIGWVTGSDLSINVMTLGGIAVAMGELVDDAIVDVENIFRRLRENQASASPRPVLRIIYEASKEVRSAIVFGTAMVILVFLPLFALSGVEGRLFAPLGVAYIVSILSSLVVSLTVTPVLSYYLLAHSRAASHHRDGLLLRVLKWAAGYLVRFSMKFAALLLLATWLLVALAAWQLTRLGADFLPQFDEGTVQVNISLPPGSSLDASNQTAGIIDDLFASMKKTKANSDGEILSFVRRTGRAELDEHIEPPGNSEYLVTIDPEAKRGRDEIIESTLHRIRDEVPGVDVEVEQPLAHLISHMLSGVTAQIAIKVYGDDLNTLERLAGEIRTAAAGVSGVTPPVAEPIRQVDELHIRPRREALEFYGVSRAYLAGFVQTALQSEVVSQVLEGQRRFDLLIRLEEPYRADLNQLGRLRVELPDGRGQALLSDLADIDDGSGANQVKSDNARRRVVIRCNTQGRDLASVVAEIREKVRTDVPLPEGYFVEYGGQFESQQRATTLIAVLALVSVAGMFVVLFLLYPSVRVTLQILNALPTAFIGGVMALVVTGQPLTVASLVGFISLGGIAARNGILLVTHYFHLMRHEGERFTKEMILRGSLERLSPVLMTALTAGIALVPLVLAGKQPGREILYPVATVILGGLITSTLCEFLIHPGLYWRFSGKDAERLVEHQTSDDDLTDS